MRKDDEAFDVDLLMKPFGGARGMYRLARELGLPMGRDTVHNWRRGQKLSHDRMVVLETMARHAGVRISWRRVLLNGGAR